MLKSLSMTAIEVFLSKCPTYLKHQIWPPVGLRKKKQIHEYHEIRSLRISLDALQRFTIGRKVENLAPSSCRTSDRGSQFGPGGGAIFKKCSRKPFKKIISNAQTIFVVCLPRTDVMHKNLIQYSTRFLKPTYLPVTPRTFYGIIIYVFKVFSSSPIFAPLICHTPTTQVF